MSERTSPAQCMPTSWNRVPTRPEPCAPICCNRWRRASPNANARVCCATRARWMARTGCASMSLALNSSISAATIISGLHKTRASFAHCSMPPANAASAPRPGHRREHAQLEEALCTWTGREAAMLFSSGWLANLGAVQALLDRDGICVQDKLNHASLLDAAQLAGATLKRYPHNDAEAAARQLACVPGSPALLATDGVFSMDGDAATLRELAVLCKQEGATLMVDDAHGLGVLGAHGAGSVDEARLPQEQVPVLMATLGKALGCMGAFVAGSQALIEGLTQFARTFVYTTAMPPSLV